MNQLYDTISDFTTIVNILVLGLVGICLWWIYLLNRDNSRDKKWRKFLNREK